MSIEVNYLAVLLAAISSMLVGAIWYSKPVFGKVWQKVAKLSDKDLEKATAAPLIVAFVSALLMALVLAHMIFLSNFFYGNSSFLMDALTTGLWLWLGFQGFRILMHDMFEKRRKLHSVIAAGNELATVMVMALIIGLMGV